ncbi:MAG: putative lipid II flippase FtsW [Chlorobium sp.]|jgi:cell division protein FtsW|uniref:FtsW/RodA/SpoVE family cell cycle protein n=1 Tax=Chlorobium sp. TaxID=1095 RepID=UPI001DEE7E61|nr:putative peptidoglycan glycosyltransferase FtsW [Chlorobium sp.]MBN1279027.1 cell division protein FtsW [Chlorobiaceae bacterium]MCF8216306.1 putative lipid II flippase FtsW [Chlorobium sp.]MCF8271208.1 putative lipid II flippase FtsW [Chlorobium sp.]MCF8287582.1 putative lipid II flippase FtsW [Chlorobium sp.]MCF8291121.1 putative lipid II flippase FtsW [Chlorobium sp.]
MMESVQTGGSAENGRIIRASSRGEVIAGKLMLLIVSLLICIGIVVVYSSGASWAENKYSNSEYFLWRQLFFSFIGILTIVFFARLDYHIFCKVSKIFLGVSVFLLALLLILKVIGVISGAARWIGYGPLKFQVSDFAKYALIFHFSRLISEKQAYIKDLHNTYLPLVVILMTVVALIALEPNFSTASLIAIIGFIMMFIGGVNIRYLLATAALVIPVGAVYAMVAPYRVARLVSFFSGDEKNMSYQVLQALIGLGNGGLFGLGIGASKQRDLYLPLSYNDFVFVIIGEEYGFIGALAVLFLFSAFLVCGLIIAKHAPDNFGKFVACGITIAIVLFAFINIAVATHLLPTTGVALPFISYGGTALVFNSLGVGILISISRYRKRNVELETVSEKQQGGLS